MSANSKISWTDHTFNPWWGCAKISPGCANCYADTFSKFCGFGGPNGKKENIWGPNAARRFFGDDHWNEPVKWNEEARHFGRCEGCGLREARKWDDSLPPGGLSCCSTPGCMALPETEWSHQRPRVFCASMADVFEDRADLIEPRHRLLQLIDDTPRLDWLLLTKRPENVRRLLWEVSNGNVTDFRHMPNVWLGTTVENQEFADKRIPHLLRVQAKVRFLSVEPMLGPVNVGLDNDNYEPFKSASTGIHWVICGGESGGQRRPFEIEWAESLAYQCAVAGTAFHMKQDGAHKSGEQGRIPDKLWHRKEFPSLS